MGRTQELEELQVSLNAVFDGKGTTVFLSGEAGSGKTRLANEFLNFARNRGVVILSGWCLSNAAIPYFPFVEAFDSYLLTNEEQGRFPGGQQLRTTTWLKGLEITQAMSPQAWKDKTFAAVTRELLLLSTSNPLILFIDDLQWADSASLSLLHYISRSISSERILILATFRSEEVSADLEGHGHELAETLRLMGRESLFKEIRLKGLNQSNVGEIAESMLSGKVNGNLIESLTAESLGIPLFVVESLRMLFEQGGLVQVQNQWRLSVEKYNIPSKVVDVILRRVESLRSSQKRVLEVASVIGEKFDPKLVAAVLSQDSLDVLETLNAISERTLLVHGEGNYYRFDHAKSREMLYENIPTLLKKEIHARIADKIECFSKSLNEFSASNLAYHFDQAGNEEKSIKYSLIAGKDALVKFSNREAIKYFTYVINTIGENTELSDEKATAMEGLGDASFSNMMFKESAKTFESLATLGGDSKIRALRKAMEASFFQNDIPRLAKLIEEADKCKITNRLEKARIIMNKGRFFSLQGQLGEKYFAEALRVFEEEYSVWDTAWDLIAFGSVLAMRDKLGEALSASLRSIALFRELGDSRWLIEAYHMTGLMLVVHFGFPHEGLRMLDNAEQLNEKEKIGDYLRLAQINAVRAWAYSSLNDTKMALSKSLLALEYANKTDSDWAKGVVYSNLSMEYTVLGDVSKAEQYFGKLMELPSQVLLNPYVNAQFAKAIVLVGKQQWEQSMQSFEAMLAYFKNKHSPALEAMVRVWYGWALLKQGNTLKAASQIREGQSFYEETAARFAHCNIQANVMAPTEVSAENAFEARLDLANVSRAKGTLIRAENLCPSGLVVESASSEFRVQDGCIDFGEKSIEPISIISVKLYLKTKIAGVFNISPKIVYKDDSGEIKVANIKPLSIHAASTEQEHTTEFTAKSVQGDKIEFKSQSAQLAFDFLVRSFREDYKNRRMPQERSGWRTFMDIVRDTKVSKYSVYGSTGGYGQAITELEKQGIVEIRAFTGERGRGGEVFKVRIACNKERVRQFTQL